MPIDDDAALERALSTGDEWQSWRALRLSGEKGSPPPAVPAQDGLGAFAGAGGGPSAGATGEGLCHLRLLGLASSAPAAVAADWLEEVRTPAGAWLDRPDEVPGLDEGPAAARVWATAAAVCGLVCVGRETDDRPLTLLRGEGDLDGRFTGGAYPTFAAAGVFWAVEGRRSETAQWALRWAREASEDWWGPWERATALTFWGAAGMPAENRTVEAFLEALREAAPREGWDDLGLTLRTLELSAHFWG
ncbi:MAG TPA: hypothetical protein VM573_06145 [Actinomycetota bacterium]|jgi:hypothetical protein|nr:hypothetical protein [Actinomycetota bacterium]